MARARDNAAMQAMQQACHHAAVVMAAARSADASTTVYEYSENSANGNDTQHSPRRGAGAPRAAAERDALGAVRRARRAARHAREHAVGGVDSAASARDACTRELTHVPIEAQLLAGRHRRTRRGCACSGGSTRRCRATTRTSLTRADSTLRRWTGSTQTLGGSRGTATRRGGRCAAAATAFTSAKSCSTTRFSSRRSTRF